MAIDVTYIVPVYNALPYLGKTVESLLGQDYDAKRLELLFVDDGSTDGSGAFLDELARDFSQMRVFHIPASGGPSTPRNVGLDHATGDYVFFCDADDWMERDATSRMVRHAREWGSDVLLVKPKGENGRRIAGGVFSRSLSKADVYASDVCQALGPCKLFRREFLEERGLRFIWDWPVWEDQPFSAISYLEANIVSIAADGIYCHWRKRDGNDSAMDSRATVPFSVVSAYISQMLGIFDERNARNRAREKFAQRILREGLYYAGRALHRERDEIMASRQFALLRTTVSPYLAESFYRMCSVQRCLMYKAFCDGDRETWEAICLEDRASDAFKPDRFEFDDETRSISASWAHGAVRVSVDARGWLPLAVDLEDVEREADGEGIAVTIGLAARALYGMTSVRLRLVKRDQGEWVEYPAVIGEGDGARRVVTAVIPLQAFSESGRCAFWDASIVAHYENGRVKKQRVRSNGAVAGDTLRAVAHNDRAPIVSYLTKGGCLSFMDFLASASIGVEERLIGSSVVLEGVPDRAFEVLGSVRLTFVNGSEEHIVKFTDNASVRVWFRAGSCSVAELS